MPSTRRTAVATLALLALASSACGGGGGSSDSTPTPQTYSIGGAVSGASTDGVLVTLSGVASSSTTTASGGLFSFSGLANGSYTLTPSKAGYTFTPASLAITVSGGNVTGQNFTCALLTYSVGGAVSGATADGVVVTLSGASSSSTTTAGGGLFSFSGLANGSYTLTPSKTGYTFNPTSIAVTVSGGNVAGRSFVAAVAAGPTYTVSGAVSGAIADGVLVTLSGPSTGTITTSGGGLFSFSGLADGSYTLTPSKAGYVFSPASSLTVTVSGANVTGRNFTATAITYSVSGTVSGAISDGVLVTLSGTTASSTTTAGGGLFSFSGLADGSYTLTPSKAGYTFSPASLAVTVSGASVTGRNFTASVVTYAISGAVSGATADGVLITLGGASSGTTTTAGGGLFSFSGLANGSYTLTPSKAGYLFSPASLGVTVAGGNVTGQSFTASVVTYSVSGSVSGAITNGVLITLSGPSTGTATTSGGGLFTFPGLANGIYTLTPSLAGYSFSPASIPVTVSGANQTGKDFAATSLTGYAISGTLTGPWVAGVTVTLTGAASRTTQTSAGGGFSFAGLANGAYTVTPSLAGYTFTPASRSVTVSFADAPGQGFAAASSLVSYSVSGNVSYSGTYGGRIYLGVVPNGCSGCSPVAGTSIAGPGSYTIRGLTSGSYTIQARMDIGGQGAQNANDPTGSAAVTVASANANVPNLALAGATPPAPTVPANLGAFPGDHAMLLFWDVAGSPGIETATSYDLSWGTDTAASNRTPMNAVAFDDAHYVQTGLTNGDVLYYKIRSRVGAALGAWSSVFGPVTVGAPAGGFTVSGTVSFSGTATGPLLVAIQDQNTQMMHIGYVASPTSPASFSVSGIPAGPQLIFAIIDQNANNVVDAGDLSNTHNGNGTLVNVSGDTAGVSVTLPSVPALAQTTTEHGTNGPGDWYQVENRVSDGAKRLAKVTLVAGKYFPVPVDIARQWEYQLWTNTNGSPPAVGDTYTFNVEYTDGTSEVLTSVVTGVLSTFPQNLTLTTTSPYSVSAPLFRWTAPASPPAGYTYYLGVGGDFGTSWWYPDSGSGMPSTTLQVPYNADGHANPATLGTGSYWWNVTVVDSNGNRATRQANFTVP